MTRRELALILNYPIKRFTAALLRLNMFDAKYKRGGIVDYDTETSEYIIEWFRANPIKGRGWVKGRKRKEALN